jgi:hypothetical protein
MVTSGDLPIADPQITSIHRTAHFAQFAEIILTVVVTCALGLSIDWSLQCKDGRSKVLHAGGDDPWLNGTIDRFIQKGLAEGATLDLLNHSTGRHSFDILDDDVRSKQIIGRTIDFLRDYLAP